MVNQRPSAAPSPNSISLLACQRLPPRNRRSIAIPRMAVQLVAHGEGGFTTKSIHSFAVQLPNKHLNPTIPRGQFSVCSFCIFCCAPRSLLLITLCNCITFIKKAPSKLRKENRPCSAGWRCETSQAPGRDIQCTSVTPRPAVIQMALFSTAEARTSTCIN